MVDRPVRTLAAYEALQARRLREAHGERIAELERREKVAGMAPEPVNGHARHHAEGIARARALRELRAELAKPLIGAGILSDAERRAIRVQEIERRRRNLPDIRA